jgi:hypothetical protein
LVEYSYGEEGLIPKGVNCSLARPHVNKMPSTRVGPVYTVV